MLERPPDTVETIRDPGPSDRNPQENLRLCKRYVLKAYVGEGAMGYEAMAPVTAFAAGRSPYGAYNMIGNVWEWTSSSYDSNHKVVRGGGWSNRPWYVRASNRLRLLPTERFEDVGVRCVLPSH